MTQTRRTPGVASRGSTKVTTTTEPDSTRAVDIDRTSRDYERGFCDGWADRAEHARRTGLDFDSGVEWGWYLANRAMRNELALACAGMPHDSVEIVRQLVRVWDRPVAP